MPVENSPYDQEQEIEESLTEELLAALALALLFSVDNIVMSQFTYSDLNRVNERFKSKLSEVLPPLQSASQESAQIGIERAIRELKLKDLDIDYSSPQFRNFVQDVFDKHTAFIIATNRDMFNTLRQFAIENGWSEAEFARRLKDYIGLTPRHLRSVLAMEKALSEDGVSKKNRQEKLRKYINKLVDWRLNLIAVQLSTEIVEGSKDAAFSYLVSTGQVNAGDYQKEWVSVLDEVTTQICTSSHRTRANIGSNFPNGVPHPPAYPPIHSCRSAIRLVKRNV